MQPTPATSPPATARRAAFDRDGYLCPLPALDPAEVAHYRRLYDAFHARHADRLAAMRAADRWQIHADTHFAFRWVDELTRHPRILDAVEDVLGPDILAWSTNWFVKMPGDASYIGWHQDGAYWGLSQMEVVTAWVALGPVTRAHGCMRVIPGSHAQPNLPQRETWADNNALSRGQELAVDVDTARAVDFVLEPGQMSMHHLWIAHGSEPNTADTPRVGFAIRYVAPVVRQDSPVPPIAMLVRGRDMHGHFRLLERPTSDAGMAGVGLHRELLERVHRSLAADRPA